MDLAKQQYASNLQAGVGRIPSFQQPTSIRVSNTTAKEGWAFKQLKKAYRFNEKQKVYLEAKFKIGESTGRKVDPEVTCKEMRYARGADGKRLFCLSEFLTTQQVSSFFSRMAAKVRQKNVQVATQDVLAAQEQENFDNAREAVLSRMNISHPVVVDQYNICSLVSSHEVKKLKLGLLQFLCQQLQLDSPVPPKNRKAPYLALLEELVGSCTCMCSTAK